MNINNSFLGVILRFLFNYENGNSRMKNLGKYNEFQNRFSVSFYCFTLLFKEKVKKMDL